MPPCWTLFLSDFCPGSLASPSQPAPSAPLSRQPLGSWCSPGFHPQPLPSSITWQSHLLSLLHMCESHYLFPYNFPCPQRRKRKLSHTSSEGLGQDLNSGLSDAQIYVFNAKKLRFYHPGFEEVLGTLHSVGTLAAPIIWGTNRPFLKLYKSMDFLHGTWHSYVLVEKTFVCNLKGVVDLPEAHQ